MNEAVIKMVLQDWQAFRGMCDGINFRCRGVFRFFCLVAALSSAHGQSIIVSSNSGSGVRELADTNLRTYNFGITTLGAGQNLLFTNFGVYISKGPKTDTNPFTVTVYAGLGGTGPAVTNYTIASSNISQGTTALFNLFLTNPISLSNGNYSVRLSTTAGSGNTSYEVRAGVLRLLDSTGNDILHTTYWVADTNANGTAGTNIQAAFVLADYMVSTTNVNFGNFRVGSTLATNVTLTNTAPPGVNSTNGSVTEQLSTASTASGSATVSGLSTNLLPRAQVTNFYVGLNSASVGTSVGTVSLSYTSLTNGTDSSRTGGATNIGGQTIGVTGVGYRLAADSVSTTNLDLGKFHIGYTTNNGSLSGQVGITNTSVNDGYSEGLVASNNGTSGGAIFSGIPAGLIMAGANSNFTLGLSAVSAVGANAGSVTLGFQSSGAGTSGLAATNIGSQVVNVTAQGYSGQAIWSASSAGSWNDFASWDVPGGKPGVDGVLSTNDSATFGSAIGSTSRTVSLNGASPVITAMTFSNVQGGSYTVVPGSGGMITMGTTQAAGMITNIVGSHSVSAAISLARDTTVGVGGNSRLTLDAVDGGSKFTKTGPGMLSISGFGNLTGATTVEGGTLNVNGSIFGSAVNVENGSVLSGSGAVGATTLSSGATISPGNAPGTITTGNVLWSGGANYNWQIYDAAGVAGATNSWDLIRSTGSLDLGLLSDTNRFNINLWTLSGLSPDIDGAAINFNNTQGYRWTILTASNGITGFASNNFNVNLSAINGTSGWANSLGGGLIHVEVLGNNLDLVFDPAGDTAVPEPGTWATGVLLVGGAAFVRWRRRAKFA